MPVQHLPAIRALFPGPARSSRGFSAHTRPRTVAAHGGRARWPRTVAAHGGREGSKIGEGVARLSLQHYDSPEEMALTCEALDEIL